MQNEDFRHGIAEVCGASRARQGAQVCACRSGVSSTIAANSPLLVENFWNSADLPDVAG
jgi:hypothetical protein